MIFHRWWTAADGAFERFIVALNFSRDDRIVDVPFSANGVWHDRLNDRVDAVSNFRLQHYTLESHWGRIWCQQSAG